MPKFKVKGALRETAEDVEVVIEASSYKEAERAANKMGMLVSDVVVAEDRSSEASKLPADTPNPAAQRNVLNQKETVVVRSDFNGLGLASMIIGIVALTICWIPFINCLNIAIAGIGGLLGMIGLFRSGKGKGYPIIGVVFNAVALVIPFVMLTAIVAAPALVKATEAAGAAMQDSQKDVESLVTDDVQEPQTSTTGTAMQDSPKGVEGLVTDDVQETQTSATNASNLGKTVLERLNSKTVGVIGTWRQVDSPRFWIEWELSFDSAEYVMTMTADDGSSVKYPQIKAKDSRGTIFINSKIDEHDEYWIIDHEGNLELWGPPEPELGSNGYFDEYPPK